MTTLHTLAGAALAAVCVLPLTQDKEKPAPAAGGGTVVAVVDLDRAVLQYPKWTKFVAGLQEREGEMTRLAKEQALALDELRANIRNLAEGTVERFEREMQHDQLVRQRDAQLKFTNEQLEFEHRRGLLMCYRDLEIYVARVAKKRGVQVVVRNSAPDMPKDINGLKPRQVLKLSNDYELRAVWYAAPEVDLTNDLIKELMVPLPEEASGSGNTAPASEAPKSGG